MPNWISITSTADLEHYVVAALVAAINEAALGDTQDDRFTRVQADVISEVRMAIASNKTNELDTDTTTIPKSLRPAACWLIANYMAQGLGISLTEQQLDEVRNAREKLSDVARGNLTIEEPDSVVDDSEAQAGAGAQLATYTDRTYTRDTQAGL